MLASIPVAPLESDSLGNGNPPIPDSAFPGNGLVSATADAAGNTVMSLNGNSTTLLGIDPAAVKADWFLLG